MNNIFSCIKCFAITINTKDIFSYKVLYSTLNADSCHFTVQSLKIHNYGYFISKTMELSLLGFRYQFHCF